MAVFHFLRFWIFTVSCLVSPCTRSIPLFYEYSGNLVYRSDWLIRQLSLLFAFILVLDKETESLAGTFESLFMMIEKTVLLKKYQIKGLKGASH